MKILLSIIFTIAFFGLPIAFGRSAFPKEKLFWYRWVLGFGLMVVAALASGIFAMGLYAIWGDYS